MHTNHITMSNYTIEQLRAGNEDTWAVAIDELCAHLTYYFEDEANGVRITEQDIEEIADDAAHEVRKKIQKFASLKHIQRYARHFVRHRLIDRARKVNAEIRGRGTVHLSHVFHDLNEAGFFGDGSREPEMHALPVTDHDAIKEKEKDAKRQQGAVSAGNNMNWSCFRKSNPSQMAERSDLRDHLDRAIGTLKRSSQRYISLAYFEERTNQEIGERMKVKVNSVGNRVQRAVAELFAALHRDIRRELRLSYFGK